MHIFKPKIKDPNKLSEYPIFIWYLHIITAVGFKVARLGEDNGGNQTDWVWRRYQTQYHIYINTLVKQPNSFLPMDGLLCRQFTAH